MTVIARTVEGEFVMISQYRHALGETRYELVAGTCEEGDTAEQSARRELLEETGYAGGVWRRYMVTSPNPTTHTNREQHTEAGEDIKVHLMSIGEVRELLDGDEIMQCLHAAPLWRYMAENPPQPIAR